MARTTSYTLSPPLLARPRHTYSLSPLTAESMVFIKAVRPHPGTLLLFFRSLLFSLLIHQILRVGILRGCLPPMDWASCAVWGLWELRHIRVGKRRDERSRAVLDTHVYFWGVISTIFPTTAEPMKLKRGVRDVWVRLIRFLFFIGFFSLTVKKYWREKIKETLGAGMPAFFPGRTITKPEFVLSITCTSW